jgi:carbonic anhydrase
MSWFWKSKTPAAASSAHEAKLADEDVRGAVEGYRRFRQQFAADRAFYRKLAEHQEPNLLWIGCSDSRVVPDIITGADPGSLFAVRNIANMVPPAGSADASVGAAIEYAVLHLGIDDIVICGHTGCGGVKAMQSGVSEAESHLHRWLSMGRIPPGLSGLDAVKHNILAQRDNLLSYPTVRDRMASATLNVHEWLYDMESGEILAYDGESQHWRSLAESSDAA